MPLQFQNSPYYNDYDPLKDFYDILFRPGYAVQARELSQIASILEEQIGRFGSSIYQNGSMVIPGNLTLNQKQAYVKLTPTYNSLAVNYDLLDPNSSVNNGNQVTIKGVTSGVNAIVTSVNAALNTLYITYTKAGTDNTTITFADSEVINLEPANTGVCQAISSGSTGVTASASIDPGVYFIFNRFLSVEAQTIILADFDAYPSCFVGLLAEESVVTPEEDISLTDNAAGSPNYAAPGAHRYKIVLTLTSYPITATNLINFVTLMTLKTGVVQNVINQSLYSQIQTMINRRTEDINGSFVTTPFVLTMREDLVAGSNNGVYTSDQGGDATKLDVCAAPGKGYVQGNEIQTVVSQFTKVNKARSTTFLENIRVNAYLGNFIYVNRQFGIPPYDGLPLVNLYSTHIATDGVAPGGSPIGTATIRGFEFHEGSFAAIGSPGPIWIAYLTNVNMTGSNVLTDIRSYAVNDGTLTCTGDVLHELDIVNVVGSFPLNGTITDGTNTETIYAFDTTNNILLTLPPDGSLISNNVPLTSSGGGTAQISSRQVLFDPADNILVYPLPQGGVASVRDQSSNITTTYSFRKVFDAQAETLGTVTFATGTNQVFDTLNIVNYVAVIETGSGAGTLIDVTSASPSFASAQTQLSFNAPSGTTVKLAATVVNEVAGEKTKTLVTTNKTVGSPGSVITLDHADVFGPIGIWTGTDNTGTNISTYYQFDSGMRDNYYDFGTLTLIPGSPAPSGSIYIEYQYFVHGSGDYFSVNSYTNFGSYTDWYARIPSYTSTSTGNTINLRDALDFRKKRDEGNTATITFTGASGYLVEPNGQIITDFSYYLGRIDKFYLAPDGTFKVVQGSPSLKPLAPADPADGGLVLATIQYGPFTFGPSDTIVKVLPNKCYTMPKIADLEKRIANLEYYTALSLLEQQTANMSVVDATTGLDRLQSGFVVDNFSDTSVADVTNSSLKMSIDGANKIMRPTYNMDSISMLFDNTDSANVEYQTLKPTNDLITLPYTEVNVVAQTWASDVINLNPYSVFTYAGSVVLNPASATWFDTTQAPTVLVTDSSAYDGVLAGNGGSNVLGTVWNAWQTDWSGVSTATTTSASSSRETVAGVPVETRIPGPDGRWTQTSTETPATSYLTTTTTTNTTATTTTGLSRQGITSTVVGVPQTTVSNAIVNVALAPFIQSMNIGFRATRLKPNTQHYVYFDDIAVSADCTPNGGSLGGNIVTDSNGACTGTFTVPAGTFNTGMRVFRMVNDQANRSNFISSWASSNFNAAGIIEQNQKTITTVIDPQVQTTAVSQSTIVNSVATSSSTSSSTVATIIPATPDAAPVAPGPSGVQIDTDFGAGTPSNTNNVEDANSLLSNNPNILTDGSATQLPDGSILFNGITYVDPIAQSFLINTFPGGYMLTSIGLFFESADPNVPVTIQIRTMSNGTPTQTIVPFSEVTLLGSQVNVSSDATVETRFEFPSPVYLQAGVEYAFVVISNSNNYNSWIATIGDNFINTDNYISTVPYAGVLFKSQNASTWTPQQGSAMTFNLYRAKFNTSVTGAAYFTNPVLPSASLPNLSILTYNGSNAIRILHPNHGMPAGSMVEITIPSGAWGENYNGIPVTQIVPTIDGDLRNAGWASGIADPGLGSRIYIISDVDLDSYVIYIVNGSNVAENANANGFTGAAFTATQNRSYDVLNPNISQLNFSGTNTAWYYRGVTNKSVNGTQVPYERQYGGGFPFGTFVPNQNLNLTAPLVVASQVNEDNLIHIGTPFANKSLVYLCEMVSSTDNLSPMIYAQRCTAVVISNRIDNRTGASTPSWVNATSAPAFIAETAAIGSTAPMRYITRPASLAQTANAIHLWVSAMRPAVAEIDVYYRILDANTNEVLSNNDWVLMNPDGDVDFTPSQSPTDFKDLYWHVDEINDFTAFQVKLVERSTNSSLVPLCQDFRCIALSD